MKAILAVAVLVLAPLPAAAVADSGSITNVRTTYSGTIAATYSVEWSSCFDFGSGIVDCSWSAAAYELPVSTTCIEDTGAIVWVSASHDEPGSETTVDTFFPDEGLNALRLCLYARPI